MTRVIDVFPERLVDRGLIVGVMSLEPFNHIGIKPDRELIFERAIKLTNHRRIPIRDFGDIRCVDILVIL